MYITTREYYILKNKKRNIFVEILIYYLIFLIIYSVIIFNIIPIRVNNKSLEKKEIKFLILKNNFLNLHFRRGDIILLKGNDSFIQIYFNLFLWGASFSILRKSYNFQLAKIIAIPFDDVKIINNTVYVNGKLAYKFVESMFLGFDKYMVKSNHFLCVPVYKNKFLDKEFLKTISINKILGKFVNFK